MQPPGMKIRRLMLIVAVATIQIDRFNSGHPDWPRSGSGVRP
jgi:hypothetical protein